jgi:hypothetical protein
MGRAYCGVCGRVGCEEEHLSEEDFNGVCSCCGDVFVGAYPGQAECFRCEEELSEQCITKDQIGNK